MDHSVVAIKQKRKDLDVLEVSDVSDQDGL